MDNRTLDMEKVGKMTSYDAWDLCIAVFGSEDLAREFIWSLDWQLEDGGTFLWFSGELVYEWFADHELATWDDPDRRWATTEEDLIKFEQMKPWEVIYALMYNTMAEALAEVFGPDFDLSLYAN